MVQSEENITAETAGGAEVTISAFSACSAMCLRPFDRMDKILSSALTCTAKSHSAEHMYKGINYGSVGRKYHRKDRRGRRGDNLGVLCVLCGE